MHAGKNKVVKMLNWLLKENNRIDKQTAETD